MWHHLTMITHQLCNTSVQFSIHRCPRFITVSSFSGTSLTNSLLDLESLKREASCMKATPRTLDPLSASGFKSGLVSGCPQYNHGVVPAALNTAAVNPAPKRLNADLCNFNKFHPISHLPLICIIILFCNKSIWTPSIWFLESPQHRMALVKSWDCSYSFWGPPGFNFKPFTFLISIYFHLGSFWDHSALITIFMQTTRRYQACN